MCQRCEDRAVSGGRAELTFTEDYAGPRWRYGLALRPAAVGSVPDGRIIGADAGPPGWARAFARDPRWG